MPKTVGVVLSGCGFMDGAEIHESVCTLLALDEAGATIQSFAPDRDFDVIDHRTGEPTGERRNALEEASRIVRGDIADLATANAAAQRPDLDLRLVLLAPAFGYHDLIHEQLGPEGMEAWKTKGTHTFEPHGWDEPVVLPYGFVEDAASVSWPELHHPTAILHGIKDDVVPLANSERATEGRSNVHLEVVDDDHRLQGSLNRLVDMAALVLDATSNPP